MSDLRVCRHDGEPLVFTFDIPGVEYVCVVCGAGEGIFGSRADATPDLQRRLGELTEWYEQDRAERTGRRAPLRPRVGDEDVTTPTCGGCGGKPEVGLPLDGSGKPPGWFGRMRDGKREFACSSSCIPSGETVLPW